MASNLPNEDLIGKSLAASSSFVPSRCVLGLQLFPEPLHQFVNRLELFGRRRGQAGGFQCQFAGQQQSCDGAIHFALKLADRRLAGPSILMLPPLPAPPTFPHLTPHPPNPPLPLPLTAHT